MYISERLGIENDQIPTLSSSNDDPASLIAPFNTLLIPDAQKRATTTTMAFRGADEMYMGSEEGEKGGRQTKR